MSDLNKKLNAAYEDIMFNENFDDLDGVAELMLLAEARLSRLSALLDEAEAALEKCADACERSYNVTDLPADGDTDQDHAARGARSVAAAIAQEKRKAPSDE